MVSQSRSGGADISVIARIKKALNIPILIDSSHGTGRRDIVRPMAAAGIAAGADGFLIETHPDPDKSRSDSEQAYPLSELPELFDYLNKIRAVASGKVVVS